MDLPAGQTDLTITQVFRSMHNPDTAATKRENAYATLVQEFVEVFQLQKNSLKGAFILCEIEVNGMHTNIPQNLKHLIDAFINRGYSIDPLRSARINTSSFIQTLLTNDSFTNLATQIYGYNVSESISNAFLVEA